MQQEIRADCFSLCGRSTAKIKERKKKIYKKEKREWEKERREEKSKNGRLNNF